MDSMPTRDLGFLKVLKDFPESEVIQLMDFHSKNGGLSRYVKFRYFFEEIRKEPISEQEVKIWAEKFSTIMMEHLCDENLLIQETVQFVKNNQLEYDMYIVSGSDGNELRNICEAVGISHLFKSIEGSPTPKTKLIEQLVLTNKMDKTKCVLIGDSFNDFSAAEENNIFFIGYNNPEIEKLTNYPSTML